MTSKQDFSEAPEPANQNSPPSSLKRYSIVIAIILCLVAALGWRQFGSEHPPSLQESYRPFVQLDIKISDQALNDKLDTHLTQALNADSSLHLSNSERVDYKMVIKESNQSLLLELWTAEDNLVHSQMLDIGDLNQQQILAQIRWLIRYEFLQDTKSKMVLDYASNSSLDPRKKQIHRCLSDAQALIVGDKLHYYEPEELPECLTKLETNNAQDKARMKLDLAFLSMQQARGYKDLGIDNPVTLAAELTDSAESVMGPHRQIMVNRIYYYWVVGTVPGETEEMLQAAKNLYPSDQTIANMRSMTYALYLNDWESIDPMSETAIALLEESEIFSSIAAIPLARSLLAGDENRSFFWLNKMNSTQLPYALWGLAVGCQFNNAPLIDAHEAYLLEEQIESFTAAVEFIQSLNYSPALTTALTQALQGCME